MRLPDSRFSGILCYIAWEDTVGKVNLQEAAFSFSPSLEYCVGPNTHIIVFPTLWYCSYCSTVAT